MSDLVLVQQDGPVAILTLNRPQRHNSLVPALLEQMLARLDWVSRQAGIRAVVLAARGRSFSTGGDVQGFADHLSEIERYAERLVGLLNQVMLSMIRLPQPIVAAVHGVVTGGSLGLVWHRTWCWSHPAPASRPTTPWLVLARMAAGRRCCRR